MKTNIMIVMVLVIASIGMITAEDAPAMYFEPEMVDCNCGETTTIDLMVNLSEVTAGMQAYIHYDPDYVNIIDVDFTGSSWWPVTGQGWAYYRDDIVIVGLWNTTDRGSLPGVYTVGTVTIECKDIGVLTTLTLSNSVIDDVTYYDGFINIVERETFNKPLICGMNMISLPLIPEDNSVSAVLSSVSYSEVTEYDAVSKQYVSTNVMNPGIGYYVEVTEDCIWEYEGIAYDTMDISLEPGLNLIGNLNCVKDVEDAMSSISGNYRYIAQWNTETGRFEIYNPNAPAVFNDFTTMERGAGYFISVKQSDVMNESC